MSGSQSMRWVTAMFEYIPTFWGGVAATLLILLAVDRTRYWLGHHSKNGATDAEDVHMTETDARAKMANRLVREFRLTTEHGDEIKPADWEAETLADIIAEYVAAVKALEE